MTTFHCPSNKIEQASKYYTLCYEKPMVDSQEEFGLSIVSVLHKLPQVFMNIIYYEYDFVIFLKYLLNKGPLCHESVNTALRIKRIPCVH